MAVSYSIAIPAGRESVLGQFSVGAGITVTDRERNVIGGGNNGLLGGLLKESLGHCFGRLLLVLFLFKENLGH